MKIIYDCTILSHYDSKTGYRAGLFFTAYNLLYELLKQGHYIELYCNFTEYYKIKKIKEFKSFNLIPEYSLMNRIAAFIFYVLSFFPPKLQPYITIMTRIYTRYFYIKSKKKQKYVENFDVYFSPFSPAPKEIDNANIKRFRMLHDVIPLIENNLNLKHKEWMHWYNRVYYTINANDYYLTNSEYTRKDVLKYFPFIKDDHIKTTLLGASDNFKPTVEPSPISGKYIFSLCTLGKRKNLEFGIKNFFAFIDKHNIEDLQLVLGGSVWNKFAPELNNTINKYDKSKILLTGYIDETELAKYYSNALCFIYPSLYEGFGLPVLEAMQCGCPVITSNTTSLPEVIGNAGIQINPKSDEEMITAYEKMYFDEEFRNECIKKGIERAKTFSWGKCANEIIDFINFNIAK